jgi:cytoskeletal protein CcmA (bactofilin family)
MARNYGRNKDTDYSTVLGKATKLSGKLTFKDSLKIKGMFEGEIVSEGRLYLSEGSRIKADITAESVVIGGAVEGNITASKRVELLTSGRLIGDIKAPSVRIADGVVFRGTCEMIKDPDTVDIFAAPVDTLKKTVSSA